MNIFTLLPYACSDSSVGVPHEHVVSITQKHADSVVDDAGIATGAHLSNEQVLVISQQCSTVRDAVCRIQKCLDIANLTNEHVRMSFTEQKRKLILLLWNFRCDNNDMDSTKISPVSILKTK